MRLRHTRGARATGGADDGGDERRREEGRGEDELDDGGRGLAGRDWVATAAILAYS